MPQDHTAFQVGHCALLFGPLGRGKDNIRDLGCLGQEIVGHHQEVQSLQPLLDRQGVRGGNHDVGAHHNQAANAIFLAEGVQHLEGGPAGAGEFGLINAPDRGDVPTGGGVVDQAITGQLVGLLSVFAASLSVALAGEAPPAGVALAHQSQRQRQVYERQGIVHALGLLLGAASGQYHGRSPRGGSYPPLPGWHAGMGPTP